MYLITYKILLFCLTKLINKNAIFTSKNKPFKILGIN
jgi:hypothetical protein